MRRVRVPVLAVQTKEGHTVTLLYLARSEFQKYFRKAIIFEKRNNFTDLQRNTMVVILLRLLGTVWNDLDLRKQWVFIFWLILKYSKLNECSQLFSICMDNATNCDKLAEILPTYVPTFEGDHGRVRCLAHIFNLIAKASLTHVEYFYDIYWMGHIRFLYLFSSKNQSQRK